MIAVAGWQESTGTDIFSFINEWYSRGISKIISTDISRDGMLQGAATELYKKILVAFPDTYLIASGGVSSMADILELQEARIPAVITGKAIYEGRISMDEISEFLSKSSD